MDGLFNRSVSSNLSCSGQMLQYTEQTWADMEKNSCHIKNSHLYRFVLHVFQLMQKK